jgi:hypothetical protein
VEQLLVFMTLASVIVASGTSLLAWRLRLRERDRAVARVNALAAAIEQEVPVTPTGEAPAARVSAAVVEVADPAIAGAPRPGKGGVAHDTGAGSPGAAGMFAASQRPGDAPRRLAPAVAVGALLVSSVAGIALLAGGTRGEAAAVPARADAPVELLALRHARQGGQFEIVGLVRNAAGAPVRERLTVVALLFDKQGNFLTSARAPVDFTRLGAGEESPFRVSLAAPAGVARYRVSFRLDSGGGVPHEDRREVK